jgi:hypothetical protein
MLFSYLVCDRDGGAVADHLFWQALVGERQQLGALLFLFSFMYV